MEMPDVFRQACLLTKASESKARATRYDLVSTNPLRMQLDPHKGIDQKGPRNQSSQSKKVLKRDRHGSHPMPSLCSRKGLVHPLPVG